MILGLIAACTEPTQTPTVGADSRSQQINEWIRISRDSTQLPMEERRELLVQAKNKAFEYSNDTLKLNHLSQISLAYKNLPDSLGFRKMNREVMGLSENTKMYMTLGESHWDLAYFFQSYSVLDSAYFYFKNAHKSFSKLPVDSASRSLKGRMLYSMGRIQDSYKDYLGAETSITAAIKIFNDLEDYKRIYNCYSVLGGIANGMKNPEKSLEYYEKAGTYINRLNASDRSRLIWQNQNNIANRFLTMEDYNAARRSFASLIDNHSSSTSNQLLYALALVSHGYSIFKTEERQSSKSS